MAGLRQETEEYREAMLSCLAESGVEGIVTIGGAVMTGGVTDENGNLPPGAAEIQQEAGEECNDRIPGPAAWNAPANGDTYRHMLDVRSCLISNGVEVAEPPSEETWIERANQEEYWTPYEALFSPDGPLLVSEEELARLNADCPQYGPGRVLVAPESAFS